MKPTGIIVLSAGLLLALGGAAPKEEASLKPLVEKAIQAMGGQENLARFKAATWKGKGTFTVRGEDLPFSGTWTVQPPGQARIVTEGDYNDHKFQRILVLNGGKGWIITDDAPEEMDSETLSEEKERLFASWVATLAPLQDKAAELASLGVKKINGQDALGIQVTFPKHRPVKLYFDQETGLPMACETRILDPRSRKESTQEVFYENYQEVDGLKHAMKVTVKVDHQPYSEAEFSDFKPLEKLEPKEFDKP